MDKSRHSTYNFFTSLSCISFPDFFVSFTIHGKSFGNDKNCQSRRIKRFVSSKKDSTSIWIPWNKSFCLKTLNVLCHDGTYAAVTFPSFNNSLNFVLNSSLVSCKSPSSWAKAASKLQMAKITKMSQYCEVFISELKDQLNPMNTQSSIMTQELA